MTVSDSKTKAWRAVLTSVPVSRFFSAETWAALEAHVGNRAQRGERLIEFFKALDWLPLAEITPNPLKYFTAPQARRIQQDIQQYFDSKSHKRQTLKAQREAYRLRVFEYYRSHISPEDKQLLEALRDYELERTGQDVNWRHYFWFTSFRQIDEFTRLNADERLQRMTAFKQDVEQYCQNVQRLQDGTYAKYYWGSTSADGMNFDDWVQQQERQGGFHQRRETETPRPPATGKVGKAYASLGLTPGTPFEQVRQQFRLLALRYHPDRPDGNAEKMKAILAAYDVLKQTVALYDAQH